MKCCLIGCCDEIDKLWKGDSVFSEFWARGQRRRPLDLGLNPKLAGRNILCSEICPISWKGVSRFQVLWFGSHRFQVFLLLGPVNYYVSASTSHCRLALAGYCDFT